MPYLSVPDYLGRFGERETILLTNDTAADPDVEPTYDSTKVSDAISDASEVVDGYLGARYVTPIGSPPRIVQGWVAALAREALYVNTGRVSDAATQAASRARQQLVDVQAGRMSLPIETGATAPATANNIGYATSSMDRDAPTFAGTGVLDSFSAPFGYNPNPCWRQGT
jgi:phage gp36-like protein